MKKRFSGRALLVGALAMAVVAAGCDPAPETVSHVQPNVIKKAMLKGEWYFQKKVVDVPGGMLQGLMIPAVVGWSTDPERVRFDVQEEYLYIRRTTELIDGAQSSAEENPDGVDTGAIVAAFVIESHFDIVRQTNPVDGVEYDLYAENATDRPWWERDYIRVDWSRNLVPNFELGEGFELMDQAPVPFYVQDECTPDLELASDLDDRCVPDDKAPFFDIVWNEDETRLERGYFDITSAFVATPRTTWADGFGEIPACWLIGNDTDECVATTYYVRNSFWKIDGGERDFEPLPYSGEISNQFGFFEDDVIAYDEQTPVNENNRRYYLNRHNIWEQNHSYADGVGIDWTRPMEELLDPANRRLCHTTADCCLEYDPSDPGSESMCASVCDTLTDLRLHDRNVYEALNGCSFHSTPQDLEEECEPTHYCTLPYDERRVRPIVYYVNPEWPEELVRRPDEPRLIPPTGDHPGTWRYDSSPVPDQASLDAFEYAYADEPDLEDRPMMEQISDRWSAPFVRMINILKKKATGSYNEELHANTPYLHDDMRRSEGGTGDFYGIGRLDKDSDGNPVGGLGFDDAWYDPERPPFVICRFNPVLGPDNDVNNIEPDICWERIQEVSHCVFDPDNPGVEPSTGQPWDEAREWPICSMREASPRLGDMRHNFVWWVEKWFDGFKLTGLGPASSDPLDGEILSGVAHVYMHANENARRIADRTMLLTGELDYDEYIDGYNLLGWHNKYSGAGTNPTAQHGGYGYEQLLSVGGLMRANDSLGDMFSLDFADLPTAGDGNGLPVHGGGSGGEDPPALLDHDELVSAAASAYGETAIHDDRAMVESIAGAQGGQAIEASLLSGSNAMSLLVGAGLSPLADWESDEVKEHVLVTRADPFSLAAARKAIADEIATRKSGDLAMQGDEASASLAYEVQRLRAEGRLPSDGGQELENALWRLARKKLVRSTTMHEIGHTVGLRHNFAGSQDFINYREPYWEIREHGCADVEYGDQYAPSIDEVGAADPWGAQEAEGCGNPEPRVGPRFISWEDGGDPISAYELYRRIHHYAYSSVMDYSGAYHLDELDLGRYDWAAVLYGYGHHFEVYKDFPKVWDDIDSDGEDELTNLPRNWQFHKTFRPGFATADSPDGCTIVDEDGRLGTDGAGIDPGARVVNRVTGEESTVASVETDRINLDPSDCFDAPMAAGQGYAVWGWPYAPYGFDGAQMGGLTVEYIFDRYLKDRGVPVAIYNTYFIAPHYTEFYRNWVDNDSGFPDRGFNRQSNRGVRDIREFDWSVTSMGNSWTPGFSLRDSTDNAMRVPYAYCNDNRVDLSGSCRKRDVGADEWERMHHLIQEWDQWYVSRSFVRGQVGELPQDYASSYYDRIYAVPKQFNDIYALDVELVSGLYNDRQMEAMMTDPYNSWGGYTLAIHDGFNMLMQTLAAPDAIDGYTPGPRPESGLYTLSYDPLLTGNAGFDIAQGARVFQTLYGNYTGSGSDDTCGDPWYRCLWNVGYYYDKVMAINALSEASTHFIGRDTAHDVRLFRISFFDNFNWQIKRSFAALMGEDWDVWAPVTPVRRAEAGGDKYPELFQYSPVHPNTGQPNPALFWRDWANPVWDITNPHVYRNSPDLSQDTKDALDDPGDFFDTRWTSIDPVTGFTVQVYAMVLGMARFQHNYDQSFYNTARMWNRTVEEMATLGDYVSFYDSESNIIYSALAEYGVNEVFHPYVTEQDTGEGIASAMISFANKMKSRSSDCDPGDDPMTPEDEEITPWIEDDCCDNPYDGVDQPYLDPCPEEWGDPSSMTPDQLAEASQRLLEAREEVDDYIKKYKGLLDFQVRLTNVYDVYLGFVGGEYDPG